MYERFTDRARLVMQFANQEAQRFGHEYIGPEHILLGLVKEGSGIASHVLREFGVDLQKIRVEVEKQLTFHPDVVSMGKLPQTPRAKKVIEYAIDESRGLNHNYVGTEHILLGVLREQDGIAARVLVSLGLDLKSVRAGVMSFLCPKPEDASGPAKMIGRSNVQILKVIEHRFVRVQASLVIQGSRLVLAEDYKLDPERDEEILTDDLMNHVYSGLYERLCLIQEMAEREIKPSSVERSPALVELDSLISELDGILTGE